MHPSFLMQPPTTVLHRQSGTTPQSSLCQDSRPSCAYGPAACIGTIRTVFSADAPCLAESASLHLRGRFFMYSVGSEGAGGGSATCMAAAGCSGLASACNAKPTSAIPASMQVHQSAADAEACPLLQMPGHHLVPMNFQHYKPFALLPLHTLSAL